MQLAALVPIPVLVRTLSATFRESSRRCQAEFGVANGKTTTSALVEPDDRSTRARTGRELSRLVLDAAERFIDALPAHNEATANVRVRTQPQKDDVNGSILVCRKSAGARSGWTRSL